MKHSGTIDNNEDRFAISHASDLNLATRSGTIDLGAEDDMVWIKFILEKVHCVQQLRRWNSSGKIRNTWTCTKDNCNKCEGSSCTQYTYIVTVEIENVELQPGSRLLPDCKYGDTVKLEAQGPQFYVNEIAVIVKEGN